MGCGAKPQKTRIEGLLGDDIEFDAAVFGAILFVDVGDEGAFGSEAFGIKAAFFDAFFDEVFSDGLGAAVGEVSVVGGISAAIGVSFDTDADGGATFEDSDNLIEDAKGLALDGIAVEGEEDLLEDLDLFIGDLDEDDLGATIAFFDARDEGAFVEAIDDSVTIGVFVGAALVFGDAFDFGAFVFFVGDTVAVFVTPGTSGFHGRCDEQGVFCTIDLDKEALHLFVFVVAEDLFAEVIFCFEEDVEAAGAGGELIAQEGIVDLKRLR